MSVFKTFVSKLKSVKNIELYIALILTVVVLIFIWAGNYSKNTVKTAIDDTYISQMEHKICNVVEKIDGCGKTTVAISYSSNEEKVYAYETETTTSGGVTKQSSSLVYVKGEPLVTEILPPKILGVVVVAEGADDPIVRFKIIEVVVTLLNVKTTDVQVFTYKS